MTTFKVMTWNVENLFRFGAEGEPKAAEDYQQKLSSLAAVILNLAPDVLALQEIGGAEALNDLGDLLKGKYPHRQISAHPDKRGIRVAFLSTLSIEEHEDIVDFPASGLPSVPGLNDQGVLDSVKQLSRGALRILVKPTADFSIHLINTHLKSKLLSYPNGSGGSRFNPKNENERAQVAGIALLKRTAEAVTLRVKANALLEGNNKQSLILLGDMNDVVDAATTQILNGPGGSEIKTAGFERPDKGDDTRLFNLAPLIAAKRQFSRINQGNPELIDHILVSQELLPDQLRSLPAVDSHVDAFGALPSVGNTPTDRRGKPASDHAPVTASFEL